MKGLGQQDVPRGEGNQGRTVRGVLQVSSRER